MTDSDDAMRIAFQQYMLQNTSQKTTTKSQQDIESQKEKQQQQQKEETQKLKEQKQQTQEIKKAEQKYWRIFTKFCNITQDQWLDIDDQSYAVVQSIKSLRYRLPIENQILQRYIHNNNTDKKDEINMKGVSMSIKDTLWSCYGNTNTLQVSNWKHHYASPDLVSSTSLLLQKQDIDLALSHDLTQHEKMMEGLRSLFSNLSEIHEALSRILDEMMKHHLHVEEDYSEWYKESILSNKSFQKASSLVELMNELFHMMSMELYRKQCMVYLIIESADDKLLSKDDGIEKGDEGISSQLNLDDELGPKKMVNRCFCQWPFSSSQSCMDESFLKFVLSLNNSR